MKKQILHVSKFVLFLCVFLLKAVSASANQEITFQGRILKPDGYALKSNSVLFEVMILSKNECVLYSENHRLDLSVSEGVFALKVGNTSATDVNNKAGTELSSVFDNQKTLNGLSGGASCTGQYIPTAGDTRRVLVRFIDENNLPMNPQTITNSNISYVPYAMSSSSVAGFKPENLLRVSNENLAPLTLLQYQEFLKLLNGSSTQFVSPSDSRLTDSRAPTGTANGDLSGSYPNPSVAKIQGQSIAATTPLDGQVLQWSAGLWTPKTLPAASNGTVTAVSSTNSYLTVNTPNSTPSLTLNVGQVANTVAAGDDARFTNSRAPTGAASGDLSGNYPAPTIASLQGKILDVAAPVEDTYLQFKNNKWQGVALDISDVGGVATLLSGYVKTTDLTTTLNSYTTQSALHTTLSSAQCAVHQVPSYNATTKAFECKSINTSIVGDVSGTLAAASVDKIKGIEVDLTDVAEGKVLKHIGGKWVAADDANTIPGAAVTSVTAGGGLLLNGTAGGSITSTGTLSVNVGTSTGQILQFSQDNKLPAIDGSALTNLAVANLTGTLPVSKGGTGATSASTAFEALSPLTTKGDLLARSTAGSVRLPAAVADYKYLRTNSSTTTGLEYGDVVATDVTGVIGTGVVYKTGTGYASRGLTSDLVDLGTTLGVVAGTVANGIFRLPADGKVPMANLNTGTGSGQIPLLNASGKVPTSLLDTGTTNGQIPLIGAGNKISTALLDTGTTNGQLVTVGVGNKIPTSLIDTGTTANKIPQLDGTGKLPSSVIPAGPWVLASPKLYHVAGTPGTERVGIGTNDPKANLSIEGDGITGFQFKTRGALPVDTLNLSFINNMDATGDFWISKGDSATTAPVASDKLFKITNEGVVEIFAQMVQAGNDKSGILGLKTKPSSIGGTRDEVSLEFYAEKANINSLTGFVGYENHPQIDLMLMNRHTSGALILGTKNNHNFYMDSTGKIGIGNLAPTEKLEVTGNIKAGTMYAAEYLYTSDARLKKNIRTFEKSLDILELLRGVRFDWKDSNKPAVGFIAQEVESVVPELVNTHPVTGQKSVQYGNITAILVEALKQEVKERKIASVRCENEITELSHEVQKENETLKSQVHALEIENRELKQRLERIEKALGY